MPARSSGPRGATRGMAAVSGSLALALSCTGAQGARASAPSTRALLSAADEFVHRDAAARHWALQNASLRQTGIVTTGTTVSVQYLVNETYVLGFARPDDVPIMRGFQMELRRIPSLSPSQSREIGDYIARWRSRLASYITTPTTSASTLQVTARLTAGGTVDPASVQVFELAGENGEWLPAAKILSGIPSPSAEEAAGEEAILAMVQAGTGTPLPPPPAISAVTSGRGANHRTVTIVGTDFGPAQGPGEVVLTAPNGSYRQLPVRSWTPTAIVADLPQGSRPAVPASGAWTVLVTTAQGGSAAFEVANATIHPGSARMPAASKGPGPDPRPYIVLAGAALVAAVAWLDLRRRNGAR